MTSREDPMFTFQFLVAFIMDLSFSFFPHPRRTSKFEQSFPFLKGKSCSEVPLRTYPSNSMFDNDVDCRAPRWMLQGCSPRTSGVHKSYNDKENSPCSSKVMIPKLTSAAISVSQQTIVGGFVGSKNYAGGSIFGEHSQIWDVIFCKILEFMSSSKDNPVESKSMSPGANNTKICDFSSRSSHSMNQESLSNKISDSVSDLCRSSVNIPESFIVESLDSSSEKVLKRTKSVSSEECDNNKSILKESAEKPSPNLYLREKYSSVVNGTCKNSNKGVLPESSSVETSPVHEKPGNSRMVNLPSPLKQSYAEVAKTVPPKPPRPLSRVFCVETVNNKKNLMCSKFDRYNNKGGRSMHNSTMGDIMLDGDTRWKSKGRSKRFEIQGSRPIPVLSRCGSSSGNESAVGNSFEVSFCVEPKVGPENGSCFEITEKEPLNFCSRGRCLSESSVDSEDSFVVFAGSPETSFSSSPYSATCVYPSVELEEESDDESISSSDYSSSEDDESVDTVDFQNFTPSLSCEPMSWQFFKCRTTLVKPSKDIKKKKVRFAEGSALAVVRPMITWSFAYREARRGNWEVYSRDRARFQCRINNLAPVLNLILDPKHRKRVFESRFVER
ncbi:hypothetical protein J437_LFUL011169 [Ladona fulva]|uniref:Protein phosphatase 1 regulatory subunit 15A/B C-terminal domain-containing protein n=1 Tax=Ladona fulva TaxID=123851 RepID=A0A8K0K9T8_LADFU|nr:hypothetical protein J437_LFUL011169 [Ladona fulva]